MKRNLFKFSDEEIEGTSIQVRKLKRGFGYGAETKVEMYKHHSVVHVSDSKKIVLAIGFNPQNPGSESTSSSTNDKNSQDNRTTSHDGDALEATRRNGIYRFADQENAFGHFTVGTYIQIDFFSTPSENGPKMDEKTAELTDLNLLSDILNWRQKERIPNYVLIAWGASGKAFLKNEANEDYQIRLFSILNKVKNHLYYLKGKNDNACYAASYSNSKGSLTRLGNKSLDDFLK